MESKDNKNDNLSMTPEEKKCVEEIKIKLPAPLHTDPKCDDLSILRFARARALNIDKTIEMLLHWKIWRDEHKVDNITDESVANEISSNKAYFYGFDKWGRACCIVRPRLHHPDKRDIDEVMRFAVYSLEKGIALAEKKGQSDQICLLYDRRGFSYSNFDRKLFGVAQSLVGMLQDNYAERLGNMYVLGANWSYWLMFKLVSPFLSQRTKDKIKLIYTNEQLLEYFDGDQLEAEYTTVDGVTNDSGGSDQL